jgi:AraC family transcriptional regulator
MNLVTSLGQRAVWRVQTLRKGDQTSGFGRLYSGVVLTRETTTDPVGKALWYIESHFAQEITLDDIAAVAGVTRYHISRVFGLATGGSIMRYMRGRRLTQAARALAQGAPDILTVAIDAGYGSHEAFTRAFRDQFDRTPESVREEGSLDNIELVEAIKMSENLLANLQPPRFENGRTLLIAGLGERYNSETSAGIPAQWQRFGPYLGHIPGQIGRTTYGVLCNSDDAGNTEYISGVEVADFSRLPKEFSRLRIPEQRYAVFSHPDHISTIRRVWFTIFNKWLPESGFKAAGGPEFERYGEQFDPVTGKGGFEVWIPIKE